MFYVYEHIRPDTNAVFYVGKGSGWRSGVTQHRNLYWARIVAKAGGFNVRKIVKNVGEELAFLAEQERIDQLKKLGIKLTNFTDGGEGSSNPSEETRRKMSESHKGEKNPRFNINSRRQRYARKEFVSKEIMSANMKANHWSKTGVYSPPKGIKRNEADILKMKEAQKNIPLKECLHCGYKARPVNISRWHNENCKHKGEKNE
jgi:Zn ribbon nucleic-acid-binding protein